MFRITHEAGGNISEYDGPLWKVVGNEVTGTVDLEVFANWFTSCCWCWNEFSNLIGNMWIPLRDCEYNTIFQIFFKAKIYQICIHFNLVSLQNIISLSWPLIRFALQGIQHLKVIFRLANITSVAAFTPPLTIFCLVVICELLSLWFIVRTAGCA